MAYLNDHYLKLRAGYLFPEIARRVKVFCEQNADAAKQWSLREVVTESGYIAALAVEGPIHQVIVEDLGSANGTFVNDRPIQRARLCDGDLLRIVRYQFRVHLPKPG